MYKKSILIFALILLILSFQACSLNNSKDENANLKPTEEMKAISPKDSITPTYTDGNANTSEKDSEVNNTKSSRHHKVTLEQINSTYQPGEILDIKTYGDNYVLIKSRQVPDPEGKVGYDPSDRYTFYNLKNGDADVLDRVPFIVEQQKIESPNHIIFFCNGQNIIAPFHDFPFLLSFERKEENIDSDSDFTMTRLPQYYKLDKSMGFGDASNAVISDINISNQYIEVTYTGDGGPDSYLLADGRIPVTKVSYIPDDNRIIFRFNKSFIAKKYKDSGNKINQGNDYIDSIELKENTDSAEIIINLKPSTKQYSCEITGSGTLKIFFSSEPLTNEEDESPGQIETRFKNITFDDQKQVEELIKAYFNALEKNDYSAAWELMSSEQKKFHPVSEAIENHWGVESIKLVSMQGYLPPYLSQTGEVPPNTPTIWFDVRLDIKPSDSSGWDEGINERFARVRKDDSGRWRIDGLSTSP